MPAFDPVRDAVLNSPRSPAPPLPARLDIPPPAPPLPARLDIPPPAPAPPPPPPAVSPSLARRATDLAVLLNSDVRASPLSHLLRSDAPDSLTDPHVTGDVSDSYFSHQPRASSETSSSVGPPTDTHSPPPSAASRPPSSSSSSSFPTLSPTMPPPPPPRSSIPYQPRNRRTPPGSVLIPMSPAEMDMYKDYVGAGTARLTKRKRARSKDPDKPPSKRHAGDVGVVVEHYNARPDVGVVQRLDSPIIGLKNFNNWVKSVLITRFAHPVLAASSTTNVYSSGPGRGGKGAGKVLDMGCGKGGDLIKWAKARVRELVAVDIAAVSVDQARSRWESLRAPRFDATFAALDCYTEPLTKVLAPAKLAQPFDVVSMQFCMHYAFENVHKARCMLDNVSRWLRPGGVFVGTIPNAEQLLEHLDELPPDQEDLAFGNSIYKIRFEDRQKKPVFGHKYWFFLQDAVENVPEYIVRWDNFVQMAAEYKLYPIYKEEFHQVFDEHKDHPEFGPLMVRMKVVDANGESAMDEDQWEAANIYIAFALEKR